MKSSKGFQVSGLPFDRFSALFALTDEELATHNAQRVVADAMPGFPCRVSLVDAEPGETLILTAYAHHEVNGPYRSSGPVYVRENAKPAGLPVNELPAVVKNRLISIRAYTADSWLFGSAIAEGGEIKAVIEDFFSNENVSYLHLHNAKPGCYSCRVDRV